MSKWEHHTKLLAGNKMPKDRKTFKQAAIDQAIDDTPKKKILRKRSHRKLVVFGFFYLVLWFLMAVFSKDALCVFNGFLLITGLIFVAWVILKVLKHLLAWANRGDSY